MLDLMNIANEGWFSWILYLVFFMVFFLFYPRIMTSQIMWKIERSARMLESMSKESKKFILKELGGKPSASTREAVDRFFEFFLIEPISTDPYGIMKKIEHLVVEQRDRFRYFVRHNAPHMDAEKRASMEMGLAGGITVHMIAKIVRHYVELVRKTKSVQIAMILQMQLPLIESMAKAMYKGVGTINGEGAYKFLLKALDADINDNDSFDVDRFRIKIWTEESDGTKDVVYDNGLEEDPYAKDPTVGTTEIGGGSIVIHKSK